MKLLSIKEVGERLGVCRSTVVKLIASGSLPAICLKQSPKERLYRVNEKTLEVWVSSKEKEHTRVVKQERETPPPQQPIEGLSTNQPPRLR